MCAYTHTCIQTYIHTYASVYIYTHTPCLLPLKDFRDNTMKDNNKSNHFSFLLCQAMFQARYT